jgi:hypothetical protein
MSPAAIERKQMQPTQPGKSNITDAIKRLIVILAVKSADRRTLDELHDLVGDRAMWHRAHDLFSRIRQKNVEASRKGDVRLEAQFSFEEACTKTLYNLGRYPGAFDADSPYWIVPHALRAARLMGIDEGKIISAVIS